MGETPTLISGRARWTNRRGAVLLLSVYFTSLVLLILGGISLQRTMTDTRAAELSRDVQRAFYLTDGAMDFGIASIKSGHLPDGRPVLEGIDYPAGGTASFRVETVTGDVLSTTRERLVRRIVATGQSGRSHPQTSSLYFRYEGPLEGIWARNFAIAHGGDVTDPQVVFLTANMRSGIGALVTTSHQGSLIFDGVGKGDPAKSNTDNKRVLEGQVSSELMSVKHGYKYLKSLTTERADDMAFDQGEIQQQMPHIAGSVSSGTVSSISTVNPPFGSGLVGRLYCTGDLRLQDEQTNLLLYGTRALTIGDGFTQSSYLSAYGDVHDLDTRANSVTLCVNSIVPETPQGWLDVLLDHPSEVVFRQPTTIYVTGSTTLDVGSTFLTVPTPMGARSIMASGAFSLLDQYRDPPSFYDVQTQEVQTVWDVSVGAKLSAVDDQGRKIPNGVTIITTKPISTGQTKKPGLIWIKPGQLSGSIYAPDSLVVVRQRDSVDRDQGFTLKSIVAKEVIMELEADQLSVGASNDPLQSATTGTTSPITILGWTAGSQ